LEAWERGLSVLTSDIAPFVEAKDLIGIKGEEDLTFTMDDSKKLAAKLDYFIENQEAYLAPAYKEKLHKVIVDKFDVVIMIDNYKALLG
jgi:hypothetical protein